VHGNRGSNGDGRRTAGDVRRETYCGRRTAGDVRRETNGGRQTAGGLQGDPAVDGAAGGGLPAAAAISSRGLPAAVISTAASRPRPAFAGSVICGWRPPGGGRPSRALPGAGGGLPAAAAISRRGLPPPAISARPAGWSPPRPAAPCVPPHGIAQRNAASRQSSARRGVLAVFSVRGRCIRFRRARRVAVR
jgi:hypothetical protein